MVSKCIKALFKICHSVFTEEVASSKIKNYEKFDLWTPEKNTKLIFAFLKHGKNWKKVAEQVDGRDVKLIASHSQ